MTPRRDGSNVGDDQTDEIRPPRPGDAASTGGWPDTAGRSIPAPYRVPATDPLRTQSVSRADDQTRIHHEQTVDTENGQAATPRISVPKPPVPPSGPAAREAQPPPVRRPTPGAPPGPGGDAPTTSMAAMVPPSRIPRPTSETAPPRTWPPVATPRPIPGSDDRWAPPPDQSETLHAEVHQSPTARIGGLFRRARAALGVNRLSDDFSLRNLFGNSLTRRTQDEVERELMVGTAVTTPPISSVRAEWPQPWLFAQTFLATAAVFCLLFIGWTLFEPLTLLPGLIIVGSLSMPITALIFFFEMNLPRNVSIVAVLRLVFLGGAASLLFSLIGFELLDTTWLGVVTAPVMEVAKLLAVVLMARQARHRYLLNGMLFGAAIGAGVAAFDSAGYALVAALFTLDTGEVIDSIVVRGVFAPFTHVVWTAMAAGALWRVRGVGERLKLEHLRSRRFWPIIAFVIVLHALWSSPLPNPLYLKSIALGLAAWPVCLCLLQEGITEVRDRAATV